MERLTPFGKYFLLERINVGGMAEVFKAKTVGVEGFEKLVAIKRILPSVAEDEEFIKMFVDEAKITSQLSHANLAQTFDLGKFEDAYFIAMEYVPGKDLRAVFERLKRRGQRLPLAISAYVIARVCEGLDYAHRKRDHAGRELQIVHRDVSPQNVIVSFEGEVKLVDFGIAKAANKITRTQAGILKGKFGYMSPEQVRGLPLDRRSDIFAAGVVLYELCTGERLFTGTSDFSVLEKVQAAKITPPSQVVDDIPLRLEQVMLKALARDADERYQHAAEMAADLTRFLLDGHGRPISRDDVAAYMKSLFPDDNAREEAVVEATRTRTRKPETPAAPAPKKGAPKLPPSLMDGVADAEELVGPEGDPTLRGPPPQMPEAEDPVTDPVKSGSPFSDRPRFPLPPMPALPPLVAPEPLKPRAPEPLVEVSRAAEPWPHDRTDPGHAVGDAPTRPMSMDDLLAAERALMADQPKRPQPPPLPKSLLDGLADDDDERTEPGVFVDPAAVAIVEEPQRAEPVAPEPPPVPRPPHAPPSSPGRARPVPPPVRAEAPRPAGPRSSPGIPRPEKLAPFQGRMALSKPTVATGDAAAADETTAPSQLANRQRFFKRLQIAVIVVALAAIAWAWLSVPHRKEDLPDAQPMASLSVSTEPEDAVVLLDGTQVKGTIDDSFTEPKVPANAEHTLVVRRDGFTEQVEKLTLKPDEQKVMKVKLAPLPGQVTIRSQPAGAQVFLDGQRAGVTPAYLASVDPKQPHAIVLEKRCYKSWQLAVPADAGKREISASLDPIPGACAGLRVAAEEKPAPALPVNDPQAMASLGFLSLGSRPPAQVFIDGVDIGRATPIVEWPLKVGKHKVRLLVGSKKKDLTVDILSGETKSEIVDLRKK